MFESDNPIRRLRQALLRRRLLAARCSTSAAVGVLDFFAGRRIRGASAGNPGDWGNFLRVEVEHNGTAATSTFNLFVSEVAISGTRTTVLQTETFRNLSMTPDTANNAFEVVNQGSRLIQFAPPLSTNLPVASGTVSGDIQDPIAGGATSLDVQLSISAAAAITINIATTAGDEFRAMGRRFPGCPARCGR